MGAHAHYPAHSAPRTTDWSRLVTFLIWLAILAGAVWVVGSIVGGELGTVVTDWFTSL